ncbi:RidA family protein [Roseomonas terrae]|jgi:2-iminobutanoate/2-iminopropanoate deaminase|uniref:RidA family protein n=1 Tax=Neoroseomonas terrae TaxID=424799 RepID=A0ABS5EBK3_9PROT|nr:RidA family protein [Neoroseomonas terrae]MBR0648392.1 RidA family protein [Neoroseomonas terrae]
MARITFSNPPGAPQPTSRYSQAALIEGEGRRLVISGQVGVRPDGTTLAEPEDQMAQALANLGAVLSAHGMGPGNLVKMTVFLTDPAQLPAWRRQRAAFLGDHAPTSTLLIVAGLANPALLIEVEGEAVG